MKPYSMLQELNIIRSACMSELFERAGLSLKDRKVSNPKEGRDYFIISNKPDEGFLRLRLIKVCRAGYYLRVTTKQFQNIVYYIQQKMRMRTKSGVSFDISSDELNQKESL